MTDSNKRLGCHFVVVCYLADTHRSPIKHLFETKPNKIRVTGSSKAREIAMAHSATCDGSSFLMFASQGIRTNLRSAARAPGAGLPLLRTRGAVLFRRTEVGLGHGDASMSALGSRRARRLVVVGQDSGILTEYWVGLPDVGSHAECAALHRPYERAGPQGTLQVLLAHLPHLRAPAPPPVSSSRSLCPEDLRTETPVLHHFELSGGYVLPYRASSINFFVFLWRYYQLKSRALQEKRTGWNSESKRTYGYMRARRDGGCEGT
jgi:hypothetical protein